MAILGVTWATIVNGKRQNAMDASNGRNFILIIESSFMRLMSAIRRLTLLHRPFDGRTVGPGPATGFAVWQTMFGGEGGYGRREPDQGRPSYDRDDLVGHGWSVTVMVAKSRRRGRNY